MSPRNSRAQGHARALLVMDQPVLSEIVKLALSHGHYSTRVAQTVEEAATALDGWRPNLVIVDMDVAGSAILERRDEGKGQAGGLPIIALTRRGDMKATLAAFDRGADDILTVPFCVEEFIARVLALMRRSYQEPLTFTPALRFGDLEIDILNGRVRAGKVELHLTSLEQNLLYLLAANAGRLITRDEILDYLWGPDYVADSNVVDKHVQRLRLKLHDDSARPRYIATVPRRGYRFVQDGGA